MRSEAPDLPSLWNGTDPIITKEDIPYRLRYGHNRYQDRMKVKYKLIALFRVFRKSELGQDLAEYCLITALLALCACGIFYHVSGGMQNIWTNASNTLATSSQPASTPAAAGSGDVRPAPAASPDTPAK